jgi:hypothetical protein
MNSYAVIKIFITPGLHYELVRRAALNKSDHAGKVLIHAGLAE